MTNMYQYSPENAKMYSQLKVIGTTYEISFNEMARLLGDLRGKIVLDFGTGTGRSALLIYSLGAKQVIGVDHDNNMISEAQSKDSESITFYHIRDNKTPLEDNSVDVAVSAHVFVEMKTKKEMEEAAQEINRVLRPRGKFVLITTNPKSIGQNYVSYAYKKCEKLKSGDPITCVVKGDVFFEIQETYWTEEDYYSILKNSGFTQISSTLPLAYGNNWLDETKVAPDLVITAIKK